MEHNICPECGGYMSCKVRYFCGQPMVEWQCSCGCSSIPQIDTTISNTTSVQQALRERDGCG